jgi:hypothetical protein
MEGDESMGVEWGREEGEKVKGEGVERGGEKVGPRRNGSVGEIGGGE